MRPALLSLIARRALVAAATAAGCLVLACSSSGSRPAPVATPETRPFDEPFLIAPAEGYPLTTEAARLAAVEEAFDALRLRRDVVAARAGVESLLAADPGFHPAQILDAQIALIDNRASEALDLVSPIAEALPNYLAAHVVRAHAALAVDDPLIAFEAFATAAERDARWSDQAQRLQPRAVEILQNRIDDALVRGQVERGAAEFERLKRWAPTDPATAESAWWLAIAQDDVVAERAALDTLLIFDPERRDALERLAALEVAAGDLQAGIARYEALTNRYPGDPELLEQVERARFRWRLGNLPPEVGELADSPQLSRADFAILLYWLVPEVRYAELRNPPIATDILDHPRRNEIVRVVNQDLLRVDETVHRFQPDQSVQRRRVLAALLTLLVRAPEPFACLETVRSIDLQRSSSLTCETAARCRLLADTGECLPTASITGEDALDLFRRTLDQLGG